MKEKEHKAKIDLRKKNIELKYKKLALKEEENDDAHKFKLLEKFKLELDFKLQLELAKNKILFPLQPIHN